MDGLLALRERFSPLQKNLHHPNQGEDIYTSYDSEYRKSAWNIPWVENLTLLSSKDVLRKYDQNYSRYLIYSVNMKPHGLLRVDLIQNLPEIICKKGYKARWVENIGSVLVKETVLKFGDDTLTTMDRQSIENVVQARSNNIESQEVRRGNIPELQIPKEKLPSEITSFTLPFFFSKRLGSYFPLHYCGYEDNMEIFLNIENCLSELLYIYDENENQISFDQKYIEKVELDVPILRGYYSIMDNWELKYAICARGESKERRDIRLVEDYKEFDSETTDSEDIILNINTDSPVHLISWRLENLTDNPAKIKVSFLKLSKKLDTLTLPEDLTSRDLPSFALPNFLPREGFHYYPLDIDRNNKDPPSGIIIKDGSLSVKVKNEGARYKLRVRLFTIKRLIFKRVAQNEIERRNFRCQYEIEN